MSIVLQKFTEPVSIIGGGEFNPEMLCLSLEIGKDLVAVDGGLNHLTPGKHFPKWIIGDLDSAKNTQLWVDKGSKLGHFTEQDSTDFEKCLFSIEAPLYLANGFLGLRADHTLASCSLLVKRRDKNIILLGKTDLIIHLNETLSLELEIGTRLSLFPLQKVLGLSSVGLKYNISGISFSPDSMIGTSNEVSSPKVEIRVKNPGMLLILPVYCFSKVLKMYKLQALF